jgi:hypothetical protein
VREWESTQSNEPIGVSPNYLRIATITESCSFGSDRWVGEDWHLSGAREHLNSYLGLIHRSESDRQVTRRVSSEHISGHSRTNWRSTVTIQIVEVVDRVVVSVDVNPHGPLLRLLVGFAGRK